MYFWQVESPLTRDLKALHDYLSERGSVSTRGLDLGFYVRCLRVGVDECTRRVTVSSVFLESHTVCSSALELSIVLYRVLETTVDTEKEIAKSIPWVVRRSTSTCARSTSYHSRPRR